MRRRGVWALVAVGCALVSACAPVPTRTVEGVVQARDRLALGVGHLERAEFAQAVAELRAAADLDPQDSDIQFRLGVAYAGLAEERGDPAFYRQAVPHFERAIAFNPDYADAQLNLGNVRLLLGDHARAIAHFDAALANIFFTRRELAFTNKGYALLVLGRASEAVEQLSEAIKIRPELPLPYFHRGNALWALGKKREALADFKAAVSRAPEEVRFRYYLGEAYAESQDPERAAAEFREVIRLVPEGEWNAHARAYLERLGRPMPTDEKR